jgi:hypothetical protein
MSLKRLLVTVFFLIAGVIVAAAINYIIDRILIPDPCAYHGHNSGTSAVFNFFYEISSDTGYHPEPTRANLFVTLLTGLGLGLLLTRLLLGKTSDPRRQ